MDITGNTRLVNDPMNGKAYFDFMVANGGPDVLIDLLAFDGLLLRFVEKQTYGLVFIAVTQNGLAMEYALLVNDEIIRTALAQNGMAVQFLKNQTNEYFRLAIDQNPHSIKHIRINEYEIMKYAIAKDPHVIQYLRITKSIAHDAVTADWRTLKHVSMSKQSTKLIMIAVDQSIHALQYAQITVPEWVLLSIVSKNGLAIKYIHRPSYKICKAAVSENPYALGLIEDPEMFDLCKDIPKKFGPARTTESAAVMRVLQRMRGTPIVPLKAIPPPPPTPIPVKAIPLPPVPAPQHTVPLNTLMGQQFPAYMYSMSELLDVAGMDHRKATALEPAVELPPLPDTDTNAGSWDIGMFFD